MISLGYKEIVFFDNLIITHIVFCVKGCLKYLYRISHIRLDMIFSLNMWGVAGFEDIIYEQ